MGHRDASPGLPGRKVGPSAQFAQRPFAHAEGAVATGVRAIAIEPIGPTCTGGTTTVPAAAASRSVCAAAFSIAKHVVQPASGGFVRGTMPAAGRLLRSQIS